MRILISFLFILFFGFLSYEAIILFFRFSLLLMFLSMGGYVSCQILFFNSFSMGLIILRIWIILLIISARVSYFEFENNWLQFLNIITFLFLVLFVCFSTSNFFIFYIRFELVVVPTFLLILGWGYSVERLQAGLYIFLYTLLASLPFLILLIKINFIYGSLFFDYIFFSFYKSLSSFWWIFMSLVFLVKLPIFLVHLWLPKAHVEAPLSGSMILAGVLLKLGGYGFYKSFFFNINDFVEICGWIFSLGILGSTIISFVCIRQVDLKCLIAYSSVAHIGPVLCSILTFSWIGWVGGYFIILAHGICSSGLFFMLGVIYDRWSTRSVLILKGGSLCLPILSFWWFTLCVFNIACPPSFNFVSELIIVLSIMSYSYSSWIIVAILLFMRGVYRVFLFTRFNHGNFLNFQNIILVTVRENFIFISHIFPIFIAFLLAIFL